MKYLIFCVALLLAGTVSAQRHDTKTIDGVDYLIKTDTSASGVITIQKIPSAALLADLTSQLGSVNGRIDEINAQVDALQAEKKVALSERKEIEALIKKLTPAAPKKAGPGEIKPKKPRKQ